MTKLTVTFHAALLLGSDDTYGGRPDALIDEEGSIGEWSYRVTIGAIARRVREHVVATPVLFDALLSPMVSVGPAPWAGTDDPLAARDDYVDAAAANRPLSPPWDDAERAFTSIEVWKQVDVSLDTTRGAYRYCWYDLPSAESALPGNYSTGMDVAQFLLGLLLGQVGSGLLHHRWKGPLRWLECDRGRPSAVPTFTAGAVGVVRRADSTALVEAVRGLRLPQPSQKDTKDKLSTIGRWHSLAAAEEDAFRRFLWHFAGIEVISKAITKVGRPNLLRALSVAGVSDDADKLLQEVIWPSRDDGRDPDRNLVFNFSTMAIVLAPHRAAADVAAFRGIARYRNQIHGGVLDPNDPPSRKIFELWEFYSPLAARFLAFPSG